MFVWKDENKWKRVRVGPVFLKKLKIVILDPSTQFDCLNLNVDYTEEPLRLTEYRETNFPFESGNFLTFGGKSIWWTLAQVIPKANTFVKKDASYVLYLIMTLNNYGRSCLITWATDGAIRKVINGLFK